MQRDKIYNLHLNSMYYIIILVHRVFKFKTQYWANSFCGRLKPGKHVTPRLVYNLSRRRVCRDVYALSRRDAFVEDSFCRVVEYRICLILKTSCRGQIVAVCMPSATRRRQVFFAYSHFKESCNICSNIGLCHSKLQD